MREPKFLLTHKLLNSLVELERLSTQIGTQNLKEQSVSTLQIQAKSTNILHLASILNKEISLKDAEKIVTGRHSEFEHHHEVLLSNFRNSIDFTRSSLKDAQLDFDLTTLMHINKLLLTNWKEVWDVRLRSHGERPSEEWDDWSHLGLGDIDSNELQDTLRFILDWYKSQTGKIHPLITIGSLLFYIIHLAPFIFVNKLTVVASTEFLLQKHGYNKKNLVPVMKIFVNNNESFKEVLARTIESGDLTEWLELFTQSLVTSHHEVLNNIEEFIANDKKASQKPFLDLNRRQLKILKYLQTIPTVRREDYVQMMNVSSMTAFRDLSDLTNKKLLKVDGKGRATRYMLTTR